MVNDSKRALTAEDLKKIDVYSDPQFMPDGSGYIFVSTSINDKEEYESHLYFQKKNGSAPVQWTFGNNKNSNLRFSPDGNRAVFQSDRSGVPQLYLLHMNGGEAQQLTTFKNGATSPIWARNGKNLFFQAMLDEDDDVTNQHELSKEEREKEAETKQKKPLVVTKLKYKSDAQGYHDGKRAHIIAYDLHNGTFDQLTTADADHHLEDVSPDGQTLLFSANLSNNEDYELTNDLFLLELTSKNTLQLTDGNGAYGSARFSPDGSKAACLGHQFSHQGATLNELYTVEIASRKWTCLSKEWDIQLGDTMIGDTRMGQSTEGPIWSEDGGHLYFLGTDYGATGLYQASPDKGLQVLYKDDNHVFGFSYDAIENTFVLGISTPTNPCNFYLMDGDNLTRLTNANTALLKEVAFSEPETLTYEADDGWEIQGWILKPYGFKEDGQYPMILEIHGGPHAMYGQTFFHELQLLAAKGYVVLYTNPRGSDGYGQAFVDACREDYGGKDYTDLMTAVDYALANYDFIDANRLGVTGGSYGGFMTNWIVGHTNRFKAAVTQRCISNWLSFYGVSDIGYFFTKWELGKNLLEDPGKLWDFSPLKYADHVDTPLLIVHGERDFRCPIEQSEQLFITLKHLRKEVEFVRFPDANHELSRSGNPAMRLERLNHITGWFDKFL
ncbi:S9 family peptidase [Virgibacillus siamensis]|uniref:S9 family peptidase n=1 Tax=Virgibacillus siamensis TaxID=480071 RepID=UPI0009869CE8|nr:S9 family peptidase [Virgibacillus siamensis]